MDILICFIVFGAAVAASLLSSLPLLYPLCLGFICFSAAALKRGHTLKDVLKYALKGGLSVVIVDEIMLLIGCLTALWRACGSIAFFAYYGVRLIPSAVFIPCAFLLTAFVSYSLGTSFGTASAIGVILMTVARVSGASPAVTAGAILSGLYFGDRSSPASSSAAVVAVSTHTELSRNIRLMLKSAILPFGLSLALYIALSRLMPAQSIDTGVVGQFGTSFRLSLLCLIPTVLMLVLAFMGINIRIVLGIDILVSFALAVLLQGYGFMETFRIMLFGYTPENPALEKLLSGGGLFSMVTTIAMLFVSCAIAGIFEGTHMLDSVIGFFEKLAGKAGRFTATLIFGTCSAMIFCNQTVSAVMCCRCMEGLYSDRERLMLDVENSVIVIVGLIPWCIACSVPLGIIGADASAIPFAFFLYLLPVCHWIHTNATPHNSEA